MRYVHLKAVWLAAALLVLTLALAACGDDDDSPGEAAGPTETPGATEAPLFPVSVTDTNGNDVTFQEAPSSIVALAPSFVEIFCELDACDALVAVDENSDYPPEVADIPKLSGFSPSVEGIAASEPDLVVISFDPGGLQDALEQIGIAVLFLDAPPSVEGVYDQIAILGDVVGNPEGADELVASMQARVESLTSQLPEGAGPRVFHELDSTLYTAGPGSFIADLYVILGAQNIASSADSPFAQMTAEAIIDADPEVIILADEGLGESPGSVAARPGWDAISAVVNGRVHGIDPDVVSRPGPRIVDVLEELAVLLYPEVFS
jgi:iron complex transport system substrate-binding protein